MLRETVRTPRITHSGLCITFIEIPLFIRVFLGLLTFEKIRIMTFPDNDLLSVVLLAVFAGCALVQCIYYLGVFLPLLLARYRQHTSLPASGGTPPVSVIVCAHNDAERLSLLLPALLGQDYPEFEVVVVDNGSKDDTSSLLRMMEQQYEHLRFSEIGGEPAFVNTTYFAETIGIKSARYDLLVFTDASCRPTGPGWLASMQRAFSRKTDFVLGNCFVSRRPGMLNRLIRYDRFFHLVMGFGLSRMVRPHLGFGGNIAFRKQVFFEHSGFVRVAHMPVGNTPVYLSEAARRTDTTVMLQPESYMEEEPADTWKGWSLADGKHQRAFRCHPFVIRLLYALELLSRLLFYVTCAWLMLRGVMVPYVAGVLLGRFAVQMAVLVPLMTGLGFRRLWWTIPLYDTVVHPVTMLALRVDSLLSSFRSAKYSF